MVFADMRVSMPKRKRPGAAAGPGWVGARGAIRPPASRRRALARGHGLLVVVREERRQIRPIVGSGALDGGLLVGGHDVVGQTQGFGEPSRALQQAGGLARHVCLLQMVDQLHGLRALGLADGLKNARLGHAAEIGFDRRFPAGFRHGAADGAGELVRVGERAGPLVPGFEDRID